jgi:hypothetical protein
MKSAFSLRRLRRFFAGPRSTANDAQPAAPGEGVFTGQPVRFAIAQTTVRAFYAVTLYFMVVTQFPEFAKLIDHPPAAPLWPVGWILHTPWSVHAAVKALLVFYTAATLAGALIPGQRWARAAVFLALLELVALKNSYGKIGHSLHLFVWLSGVLILLPKGWEQAATRVSRRDRQSALLVFWTCQAVLMLSYTMSGLGKLGGALYQLAIGEPNAFLPGGLSAHVAERLLQTHSRSQLGAWIVDHPWLTWPAMPGAVCVELFAFWAVFRPSLARAWAGALIVFHVGVFFSMTINFPQSCLLLALFFFQSPFEPARSDWRKMLWDLPFLKNVISLQAAARKRFEHRKDFRNPAGPAAKAK